MGYYRGVPHDPTKKGRLEQLRRERLDRLALAMRRRNLTTGSGCKAVARAIERRTGRRPC